MIKRATLNTDGGSRGNPGESGIGFVISVDNGAGSEVVCRGGAYIGSATNNVAEYRALIWGLLNARALCVQQIAVRADSELMVKQILGTYRVKNEGIKPLYAEAMQLLGNFETYSVEHVMRSENSAADELANQAMDAKDSIGNYPVKFERNELFLLGTLGGDDSIATHTESGETAVCAGDNKKGSSMENTTSFGTYTLWIKEHFDAAHALVGYPGECRNLHGHTWDVEVSVVGTKLDEVGIVYDFKDLKSNLMSILNTYDHKYLNDIAPFDKINATAENLARVIYEHMETLLPQGVDLVEVGVWESPIAKLTYRK